MSPKLALAHTLLTAGALVGIHLTDVLCPEEARNTSLLDITFVCTTVPITVADADYIRCHATPYGMEQSLFVELADNLQGFFFTKNFERSRALL